ncbi:Membrane protein TerC, possibly involved in tellurium resistance [Micromonospora pallida]|uniref:Membrane protein TerC, possibly involved in tellurium resistance n=1 Tax=Micromonospora pallida TaxID=145854 RepID=A0A1C6RP06_9ACTN|nr:TerC family protein [Micromonospora pallida]SCL18760.1 Membrane protein TerC, possibly involved in tellurium resistance [Micromonospora pallida]
MEFLASPELWVAFATLLLLEIVLGIDNVVFISILSGRLPEHQQARARTIGLSLALITRLLLLASLSWVIGLTAPLFTVLGQEISGRDLILLLGGLFLLGKATYEIHEHLEGADHARSGKAASFASVIAQILVLDVVFSLDSVITAVGMVDELVIMVAAVIIAMVIMLLSAGAVSGFVNRHPTVKMLALSFLLLIGASLIAEGFDQHIPKGYVYGPIAFSIFVEFLNLRVRSKQKRAETPVHLHPTYVKNGQTGTGGESVPAGK